MQKIYLTIGLLTLSLPLTAMKYEKHQIQDDADETIILSFFKSESEKDTEALKQEFMIRQLLKHKAKEEKALVLKNSSSECACKVM